MFTSGPVWNQGLLFKGKKASAKSDDTLGAPGSRGGSEVQMPVLTVEENGDLRAVEER